MIQFLSTIISPFDIIFMSGIFIVVIWQSIGMDAYIESALSGLGCLVLIFLILLNGCNVPI